MKARLLFLFLFRVSAAAVLFAQPDGNGAANTGRGAANAGCGVPNGAEERKTMRAREERRFASIRDNLKALKIEFEERPLLEEYGSFGTGIAVQSGAKDGGEAARFILAVPLLSASEAALIEAGGEPPEFSFAQKTAFEFLSLVKEEEVFAEIYFLADSWVPPDILTGMPANVSGAEYAGFAAWADMLGDEDIPVTVVYLDAPLPGKTVVLDAGAGRGRTPLAYIRAFAALVRGIPAKPPLFLAPEARNETFRQTRGLRARLAGDYEDSAAALFLSVGNAAAAAAAGADGSGTGQTAPAANADSAADTMDNTADGESGVIQAAELARLLARFAPAALETMRQTPAGENDINYMIFRFSGKNIIIRERYIIFFAALFFTVFFSALFFIREKTKKPAALCAALAAALIFCVFLFRVPAGTPAGNPAALPLADFTPAGAEGLLSVTVAAKPYLRRVPLTLSLQSAKEPFFYRISLEEIAYSGLLGGGAESVTENSAEGGAENPAAVCGNSIPFLYESPLPVIWDGGAMRLVTGAYPPRSLTLKLALPEGLSGVFNIEVFWTDGTRAQIRHPATPAAAQAGGI